MRFARSINSVPYELSATGRPSLQLRMWLGVDVFVCAGRLGRPGGTLLISAANGAAGQELLKDILEIGGNIDEVHAVGQSRCKH